jgi:hypothetical protein
VEHLRSSPYAVTGALLKFKEASKLNTRAKDGLLKVKYLLYITSVQDCLR